MLDQARAFRPKTLDDITAMTRQFDGQITFVAGGTDLIIAQDNAPWPDLVTDISQTAGLDFVHVGDGFIDIGAATTMTTLAQNPAINENLKMLAGAAAQIGSVQIRNRATIGGNIASAEPAGDLLPVLKCLEARISIMRRCGRKETLGFDEVVLERGKTLLENGDLITGVRLPLKYGMDGISAFAKIGTRQVLTIARLNLAACADFDRRGNCVRGISIVAGAMAPVPLRLNDVEAVFRNRLVDQTLADDFLSALIAAVDHAIPRRQSHPYKRHAVMGLGLDLMHGLFGREFDVPKQLAAIA